MMRSPAVVQSTSARQRPHTTRSHREPRMTTTCRLLAHRYANVACQRRSGRSRTFHGGLCGLHRGVASLSVEYHRLPVYCIASRRLTVVNPPHYCIVDSSTTRPRPTWRFPRGEGLNDIILFSKTGKMRLRLTLTFRQNRSRCLLPPSILSVISRTWHHCRSSTPVYQITRWCFPTTPRVTAGLWGCTARRKSWLLLRPPSWRRTSAGEPPKKAVSRRSSLRRVDRQWETGRR